MDKRVSIWAFFRNESLALGCAAAPDLRGRWIMVLPPLWLLFAAYVGRGGVGFEEDVGGFFEEEFAEFVESFLTRGPVNLLVFLGFQPLSAEVIHEEAIFVGWADWRGD